MTRYEIEKFADINNYKEMKDVFKSDYSWFIEEVLEKQRPKEEEDPGWVYVYQRSQDKLKLEDKQISQVLLHKIGRTKNTPSTRV